MNPCLLAAILGLLCFAVSPLPGAAASKRVLVYTRNYVSEGKGYVHDNIAASVAAIEKMGRESGFAVEVSDNPEVFTPDNLRRFDALIFANSNNEAFSNDAQRDAFRDYIRQGGGFVGIHSASASERRWPYYWAVVGGKFVRHPKMQPFVVRVTGPAHPSTAKLPREFVWTDECYYHDYINPGMEVVLTTDPAKIEDPEKEQYPGNRFGNALPLAWFQRFDGGRQFYTALGHNKEDYTNPLLYEHIRGGILWALGVAE